LIVGKLDRNHVKAAMEKGISAHQIISYLSSHAHPQMYLSVSALLESADISLHHYCILPWLINFICGTRNGIGCTVKRVGLVFSLHYSTLDSSVLSTGEIQGRGDARVVVLIATALMHEFASKELFEDAETYAKTIEGLALSLPEKKILFIDPQAREAMREYVKERQAELRGM
jgi:transcription initiation factor TFIIH subunit 4